MSLADAFRAAGLTVAEYPNWPSRGAAWFEGQPVGVLHHHTAPPVPFPVSKLAGIGSGLVKCNVNTKPDGTVWMVAAKACNYSSGPGSSVVLAEVKAGTPPSANARDRGLRDDINGNPWFFNFENDHPGDGSPLPQVQFDAIITATQVTLDWYGLDAGNVISHAEWTYRKGDPYWDGDRRCIEAIRQALIDGGNMTPEQMQTLLDAISKVPRATWSDIPGGTATAWQTLIRTKANTDAIVGDFATEEDVEAAVDALLDQLPSEVVDALYDRLTP